MDNKHNKQNPFLAKLKHKQLLTTGESEKRTMHLELDLSGSDIAYAPGDSIGVCPKHNPELVRKTLAALKADGTEQINLKDEQMSFHDFLTEKANITTVTAKLFKAILPQLSKEKQDLLAPLLLEDNRQQFKDYLAQHEVWDFLASHPEAFLSPQDLANTLMPLLPRFYSISSSQQIVGEEVHLMVAPVEYQTNGQQRRGVCTHFLCDMARLGQAEIPIFVQSAHSFGLPDDHEIPIIMIGPGTGVAPFRAFLQERLLHRKATGKHWLFFGEWNRATHFYFQHDWDLFATQGHLQVDLAFSRDQPEKIYVQHKMMEKGHELFHWLEQGAYLYVCGDAEKMAKDVEAALHQIVQMHGQTDTQGAKDYVKNLRHQKRYLRDVY